MSVAPSVNGPSVDAGSRISESETLIASLDADGDGHLDASEIKRGLEDRGIAVSAKADEIVRAADADGDGKLSAAEIMNADKMLGLLRAVDQGDAHSILACLYSGDVDLKFQDKDDSNKTLLHKAAERGNTVMVALLIEKKIDLMTRDGNGYTALELAINNGHKECAFLLAKKLNEKVDKLSKSKCSIM